MLNHRKFTTTMGILIIAFTFPAIAEDVSRPLRKIEGPEGEAPVMTSYTLTRCAGMFDAMRMYAESSLPEDTSKILESMVLDYFTAAGVVAGMQEKHRTGILPDSAEVVNSVGEDLENFYKAYQERIQALRPLGIDFTEDPVMKDDTSWCRELRPVVSTLIKQENE